MLLNSFDWVVRYVSALRFQLAKNTFRAAPTKKGWLHIRIVFGLLDKGFEDILAIFTMNLQPLMLINFSLF
jgi:hypothetical protein